MIEKAKTYFAQLGPKSGELNDDLEAVAGGGCGGSDNDNPPVSLGDTVQITSGETCSSCGDNIGIVNKKHSRGYCIKCKECKKQICDLGECTYVVSG